MNATPQEEVIVVVPEEESLRLDKFLSDRFCEKSRSYFQYLIKSNYVLVNDKPVKKRQPLHAGDSVSIQFVLPPDITLKPEKLPLDILYEDEHIIALNKSAGMVVHPAPGNWNGTVVNGLLHHCNSIENPENTLRPGIVHRLDKETSGLLLVAKTYEAQQKLVAMFAGREIHKQYLAICVGKPVDGEINAPIGRHPVNRKKMSIRETGKNALSICHTLAYDGKLSVVEITLETGRTHQIRVHMQHHGTPVLGDNTYGSLYNNRKYQALRQMLHAKTLRFKHPITNEPMEIKAPPPEDIATMITKIRGSQR